MKRPMLGLWVLTGLAGCDTPTNPDDRPDTLRGVESAAVEQQFTVRSLGTLGGTFSSANAINEQGELAGFSQFPSGETHAVWRPGQGMRSGPNGVAWDINEFGQIVGTGWTAGNRIRATLWMLIGGPLVLGRRL